ncbi:hypothetical protein SPRG_17559 [Saprolegnia parasitica CBS 223.65]|uniref:Uncharacterized protein n=1 Tax=Saprolegnia parasitica (strain CBS 223.65) TaxID=695850 RepID=A0A067BJT3_SAPPC|nr:hypothetical protein SPRG_17559 [Saprolegnia parasitica CBS 223.65]KDO17000.1 hypothetical protein SPRG_17559 [Saprolegnia parasitica CBS 223.65]|eukprot:XP_012212289.1 hypothetical protein SPRG_17559 [Saprolegnia parasitica CBS 223.65]
MPRPPKRRKRRRRPRRPFSRLRARPSRAKMLQAMLEKHRTNDEHDAKVALTTGGEATNDAKATAKSTDDDDEAKPSAEPIQAPVDDKTRPSSVNEDDGAMTIDEFNDDDAKPAPATTAALEKAVLQDEYDEERTKLAALKEASARVISPFSRAPLQSMRSAKRGSSSQNAR